MSRPLDGTAHRPWPLPSRPWIMAQSWHDLLFAHWPIDSTLLRGHIPAELEIDTFERQAWIAVVPFRMSGVRLRLTPALPLLSAFAELNVRTYVVADKKPGVWFFSLDAQNPVAVAAARAWFHLPYFRARMCCEDREGWIHYASDRTHRGANPAVLHTKYRPTGKPSRPNAELWSISSPNDIASTPPTPRAASRAAKSTTHPGNCKSPKRNSSKTP